MLTPKRLATTTGILALAATLGVTALEARTRKGDKLLTQSRAAELRKEWDKALTLAEEALVTALAPPTTIFRKARL